MHVLLHGILSYQFDYQIQHPQGRENCAADALSSDRLAEFDSLFPQAPHSPIVIPSAVLEMLLDPSLTWTSRRWNVLFVSIFHKALPNQPRSCIPLHSDSTSHSVVSMGKNPPVV